MKKTYRPYAPGQSFLLPPSPLDWLPEDHLARFILDVTRELDLSAILAHYERETRGFPPHHPMMMVALLLYAYAVGVPSSRKIEKRTYEDIAFRMIAGNTHPDYSCISEFRRIHLKALSELFVQVLALCEQMGLVKLGSVALDGTKIKANASKHKAMSYERMQEEEVRLAAKVVELMKRAEAADQTEDAEYGKGRRGDELPEDLRRAQDRLHRIRKAKTELETEAKEQAQVRAARATEEAQVQAAFEEMNRIAASRQSGEEDLDDEPPPSPAAPVSPEPLPVHQVPTDAQGQPTGKAQRNFTDAESRILKTGDGYVQGYNAQAAVDADHQIIVAQGLSNQAPDAEYLLPMFDRVLENCGKRPERGLGDAGYFSAANLARLISRGIDAYIAPGRVRRGQALEETSVDPAAGTSAKDLMRKKLSTREGAKIYSRRKVIVEPVFGQIKNRGFRQFLLRGLVKVSGEWALITLTHNLLKLHRARKAA